MTLLGESGHAFLNFSPSMCKMAWLDMKVAIAPQSTEWMKVVIWSVHCVGHELHVQALHVHTHTHAQSGHCMCVCVCTCVCVCVCVCVCAACQHHACTCTQFTQVAVYLEIRWPLSTNKAIVDYMASFVQLPVFAAWKVKFQGYYM